MAAPGGTGPIGPFPRGVETDEQKVEYDKLRRRVLWSATCSGLNHRTPAGPRVLSGCRGEDPSLGE